MVQIIGLMFAAYAIARLIDQALPTGGWFPRLVAVRALLAVLFGAPLLVAAGGLSNHQNY